MYSLVENCSNVSFYYIAVKSFGKYRVFVKTNVALILEPSWQKAISPWKKSIRSSKKKSWNKKNLENVKQQVSCTKFEKLFFQKYFILLLWRRLILWKSGTSWPFKRKIPILMEKNVDIKKENQVKSTFIEKS